MAFDLTNTHIAAVPTFPRRRGYGALLTNLIVLWRSRRALAQLDARALEDVGLTQQMAQDEAERPVWDVPANWRC
ncbi:MAG: DUF1127 domain-containing protein [Rhodobacteraceae bacterium]|nr:DUF1127 domain-containing protein [Paracoccaceae bacterium]